MQKKEEWMTNSFCAKQREVLMGIACLVIVLALLPIRGDAQVTTTTVQGTVYRADGSAATGTVIVSWAAFSTSASRAVAAGSTTATIGQDGFVSLNLAPNKGSYPEGSYYTAVYHLNDGTVSKEYWVVPETSTATISAIRAQLAPATLAVQPIDKSYVDSSIAAITGNFLPLTGGTMSGALVLEGDPVASEQATTKHYTDELASTEVPLAGGSMTGTLNTPNNANKLPRVDVRHPDFAAGCPNTADPSAQQDSSCAIQAAIAYALATPQGSTYPLIYIPAGTYKISSTLRIPCQMHFVGDGPDASIIEATNNGANAITIYPLANAIQPDLWTCNGSLENMTIHAPSGHLYTSTLVEIQNSPGYTLYRVRGSGGGGRGLVLVGSTERLDVIDTEWDAIRWPIVAIGNELKFLDTQIASAGVSSDGYCWGPRNCVNGVFPGLGWTAAQVLTSASGNGSVATYVVTGNGGSGGNNIAGVSPLVAGHWFTTAGISGTGTLALNGVQQITAVYNNCSAVSAGQCTNSSATQYVVQAANTAATSGTVSVTGATYKPTILPERVAAFYLASEQFSVLGGSIKANWYTGCFRTDSAFSGLIEGFYCEGFPANGQPHMNADLEMNGEPFSTTLTGTLSGNVAPVASTLWAPTYINDPNDLKTFTGAFSYNLYPQDYVRGSTACSSYVKTPAGNCVQQGEFETTQIIFSGDGSAHVVQRNQSGTTVPTADGNIAWPAGSIIAELPLSNYGTLTANSNHFDSVDPPGPNWATYCNDSNDLICASVIVGSIPNGTTVASTGGAGSSANASLENDEWWGVGGPANENNGEGFIKVSTKGNVTATSGGALITAGETAEVMNGQFIANGAPTVVAVQEADGTYAWTSYSNPQRAFLASSTNGPFYESMVDNLLDPVLGANPNSNFAMGHQFAGSSCSYDTPPAGQAHSTYRFCMKGGPGNSGANAGWEYDIWNGSSWVNGFSISGQNNSTANLSVSGTTESQGALTAAAINGEITVDGVTYPTLVAAWNAAFAQANSSGKNQAVRLGPGTFAVTATLSEPANGACISLLGSGGATVNAGSAAATTLSVTTNLAADVFFLGNSAQAQGCTFKDFVLLGATNATHGFELQWFRGLLIDNVTVNDTTAEGILLGEETGSHQANFLLRNVTVSYNSALFTPATRPAYGVHLQKTAIDSHLDDITVRNALAAAVYNEGTGNTGYLIHGFGFPYTCTTAPCANNTATSNASNSSYATNYVVYDVGGSGSVWTDTYADSPAVAGFYVGANGVAIHGGHIQWPDLTSFPAANLAYVAAGVTNNMLIGDVDCLGMSSSVNWITYAGTAGNPPSFTSVHHLTGCGNYSQSLEPAQVTGFSSGGANIDDPSGAVPRVWSTPIAAAASYPAFAAQLYTGYLGDIFQGHFSGLAPFFNITSQGTIRSNGGIALSTVLNTSATLTLTTANKNVIANASSGAQTLTLPSCFTPFADNASPTGLEITVVKSDTSANAVRLQTVSSQSINYAGAVAQTLTISSAGKRTLVCGPDFNWYAY